MTDPRLHVGTSGYSYPEWKGTFYPEDLAATKFLSYYSGQLSTVEVNNTFYRFPKAEMFEKWREQTPEGFTFAVKANMRITHRQRLKGAEETTRDFVERCGVLGDRLGPLLFQLPPNFKRDDERLADFLDTLPPGGRFALEFRHETWFDDAVFADLERAGVALVITDDEKLATPRRATASFSYGRMRKDDYSSEEVADWRKWIEGELEAGREVFVYLKHKDSGASPEPVLRQLEGQ